jgi:hypothetical protein
MEGVTGRYCKPQPLSECRVLHFRTHARTLYKGQHNAVSLRKQIMRTRSYQQLLTAIYSRLPARRFPVTTSTPLLAKCTPVGARILFSAPVQTGPGAHLDVAFITHFHLVPMLRISGVTPPILVGASHGKLRGNT